MTERTGTSAGPRGGPAKDLPTDRLRQEAQDLLAALGERALGAVSQRIGDTTQRLTEFAEHGGPGLAAAVTGAKGVAGGKSAGRSLAEAGLTQVKEKAKNMLPGSSGNGGGGGGNGGGGNGGSDGGGKKLKATNIVESIDVGVPVSVAYNQWTEFEDFPTFMKKVENVKQQSDTELDWQAQVFLSHRTWRATVVEQVPDERIVWESTGEKGHADGTVTFHELAPDLTRIMLVLVYHPQGFFERTGNLWRAQGRRARLELKHFQRHVMTETILHQDEVRGWRGEVADGEVVRGDEEVRAEEEGQYEDEDGAYEDEGEDGEAGNPEDPEDYEDAEDADDYDEEEEEEAADSRAR